MKRKLAVIGLGSAGITALCHFLSWMNEEWEITSIHDPNIPILGIGESTNPSFINTLEWGLDFNLIRDLELLDGTLKYGTSYKNWREQEFRNPLLGGNTAAHINTFKLKEFALPRLTSIWGDKFKQIHGNAEILDNGLNFVTLKIADKNYRFDYVIDCSGFPKSFENYNVLEQQNLNHALIHNSAPKQINMYEPTYTGHIATKDGWMFEIPLISRNSYGYMFNDDVTPTEEAKINFAEILGIDVSELQNIEYKFKSFYAKKLIVNRIIKGGNSAVFFEPLFANSLWLYDNINKYAFRYICGLDSETHLNQLFISLSKNVEDVIAFHYHGGSNYDTPFWDRVKTISNKKLEASEKFKQIQPVLQRFTRNKLWDNNEESSWAFGSKQMVDVSRNFGYKYFE
jgi:hypothetical protein